MFLRVNCRKITFPRSGLVDVKRFVSSALVKELRALSGAPMMDCKIALQAESVNGDITKAMDFLRAKGKAKAAKGAGRVASEGLIVLYNNADKGVATLTEINSETDFVSRNKDFQSFAARVVDHVNNHFDQGTILIDELLSTQIKVDSNPISLQDSLYDIINVIRENIVIRRAENFSLSKSPSNNELHLLASYVHGKVGMDWLPSDIQMGRSASIVSLALKNIKNMDNIHEMKDSALSEGKRLAMHVVASCPQFLSKNDVPADIIERETAIMREQMESEQASAKQTKSKDILEKILMGKLNKRLNEICLLGQEHVAVESAPTIEKFLKELGNKWNCDVSITGFTNWTLTSSNEN